MNMTHYMELLTTNQPWNLLLFMAVPVVLAETVAVTELFLLLRRDLGGGLRRLNRVAGIIAGPYFLGIFAYLLATAVIPLTATGGWRGPIDVLAVGFYLLGVVPLAAITLLDTGALACRQDEGKRLRLHVAFVAVFLVVAHIAMILGMMNPGILMFM